MCAFPAQAFTDSLHTNSAWGYVLDFSHLLKLHDLVSRTSGYLPWIISKALKASMSKDTCVCLHPDQNQTKMLVSISCLLKHLKKCICVLHESVIHEYFIDVTITPTPLMVDVQTEDLIS